MLGSRTGRTTSVASALLPTSALLPVFAGCAPTAGSAPIRLDDGVVADDAAATTFTVSIGTVTVAVGVPRDHLDADGVPWGGLLGVAGVSSARIALVSGEDGIVVVADPIGGPSDTVTVDLTLPAPPVPAALG